MPFKFFIKLKRRNCDRMVLEHHKSMISMLEGIRSINKALNQPFIRAYPDFSRIKLFDFKLKDL